jgi:hypothetical protein
MLLPLAPSTFIKTTEWMDGWMDGWSPFPMKVSLISKLLSKYFFLLQKKNLTNF